HRAALREWGRGTRQSGRRKAWHRGGWRPEVAARDATLRRAWRRAGDRRLTLRAEHLHGPGHAAAAARRARRRARATARGLSTQCRRHDHDCNHGGERASADDNGGAPEYARDGVPAEYLAGYPTNLPLVDSLRSVRHDLATLLGYPSWAA